MNDFTIFSSDVSQATGEEIIKLFGTDFFVTGIIVDIFYRDVQTVDL